MSSRSRYIMIGGFLGAGKSTAILKLAQYLSEQKLKVGLITNDQGERLVDTAFLSSHGFPVQEISGGCFCCRFNSLVDAADKLVQETRPDVFIAEPVGSCTDLVATVSYPLRRIYGDAFSIAPLSVVVDPIRAMRVFGLESGKNFSDKVIYIYRKQLEEADSIVINKLDLVSGRQIKMLTEALSGDYPGKRIYVCSARSGTGLQAWFDTISSSSLGSGDSIDIDYEIYGEGEALLGWVNATVELDSEQPWDGNAALLTLAQRLADKLDRAGAEIAHLKMTLSPHENIYGELAVVNQVRNDQRPEISQALPDELLQGQLIINLRAEADPGLLGEAVTNVLNGTNETEFPSVRLDHLEQFKPSQPQPVHRDRVGQVSAGVCG